MDNEGRSVSPNVGQERQSSEGSGRETGVTVDPGAIPRSRGHETWRVVRAAVLILAAGLFLYSLWGTILNPVLLYCVLIALLIPYRGVRGHAQLVAVASVLVTLWVIRTTGSLLAPFVLAFVLAYILDPLVDRVAAIPRVSRPVATLLILGPFFGAGALVIGVAVPELLGQTRSFVGEVPAIVMWLRDWITGLTPETLGFDIPLVDEAALLTWAQELDAEVVTGFIEERRAEISNWARATVLGIGRGFGTVFTGVGYLALMPVLMYYLLRDFDRIIDRIEELIPRRFKSGANRFAREYDQQLSSYLRGQVLTSLITGALTYVGLLIVGFPYALLLSVTVAVLGVVPYLGLVVSIIPAIILALISESVGVSLLKVAIVYGAAQGIESMVLSPWIVGGSVGMHPVWILLALLLGGLYFGFVGLLIGVPVAVAIKLLLRTGLERYRRSPLYLREPEPSR